MIAVVQRRQLSQDGSVGHASETAVHLLPAEEQALADTDDVDDAVDEAPIPTGRYNAKRLTARLEATR
jgi:hypothetical protein